MYKTDNLRIKSTAHLVMDLAAHDISYYGKRSHDMQAVRTCVDNIVEVVATEMWRRPLFIINSASPMIEYFYRQIYDLRRTDELGREYVRLNLFPGGDVDILIWPEEQTLYIYTIGQSDMQPHTELNMVYHGYINLRLDYDGRVFEFEPYKLFQASTAFSEITPAIEWLVVR